MKSLITLLLLLVLSPLATAQTPKQAADELDQIAKYHYSHRNDNRAIIFYSIDKNWVERSINYFKTAMKDKSLQADAKQDLAAILGMYVNKSVADAIAFIEAHNSNSTNGSYLMMKKALPCFIKDMNEKAEKAKALGLKGELAPLYRLAKDNLMALDDFSMKNNLGECVMWKNEDGEEVPPATFDQVKKEFEKERKQPKRKGLFGLGLFR